MNRACQIVKKLRKVKDGVLLKTVADQLRQLIGLGCVAIVLERMDGVRRSCASDCLRGIKREESPETTSTAKRADLLSMPKF